MKFGSKLRKSSNAESWAVCDCLFARFLRDDDSCKQNDEKKSQRMTSDSNYELRLTFIQPQILYFNISVDE